MTDPDTPHNSALQLVASFFESNWIDLGDQHRALRESLEGDIHNACTNLNGHQSPAMIHGEYRIGKSQLLYHLCHHAWRTLGVPAFYFELKEIIDVWEQKRSDKTRKLSKSEASMILDLYLKQYAQELLNAIEQQGCVQIHLPAKAKEPQLISDYLAKIQDPSIVDIYGAKKLLGRITGPDMASILKNYLNGSTRCLLLIDEFSEDYSKISPIIEEEGGGALRKLYEDVETKNNAFHLMVACGPSTGHEVRSDNSAETGRIRHTRIPFPEAKTMMEHMFSCKTREAVNALWWLGRGRPGQIKLVADVLKGWQPNNDPYYDFITRYDFLKGFIDNTVAYWNDQEFNDRFKTDKDQNAVYPLILQIGPVACDAKLRERVDSLRKDLLCAQELLPYSTVIAAIVEDLSKWAGDRYEFGKHATEIRRYLGLILRHLSNDEDMIAWGIFRTRDKQQIFRDRVLLPLLHSLQDQLTLYGTKVRDSRNHTADELIYEMISELEKDREAVNDSVGDYFDKTYLLFSHVADSNDVKYAQVTPSVLRAVVEQPIGSPDIHYNKKTTIDRFGSLISSPADNLRLCYLHYKDSKEHLYFIPEMPDSAVSEQYISKVHNHISSQYADGKYDIEHIVIIVCLHKDIPQQVNDLVSRLNRGFLQPMSPVIAVTIAKMSTDLPERNRSFIQSLCAIAMTEETQGSSVLVDLEKVAKRIGEPDHNSNREQRRSIGYYHDQAMGRDISDSSKKISEDYRNRRDALLGYEKHSYAKLARDLESLLRAGEVNGTGVVPYLCLTMRLLPANAPLADQLFKDLDAVTKNRNEDVSMPYGMLANGCVTEGQIASIKDLLEDPDSPARKLRTYLASVEMLPIPLTSGFDVECPAEQFLKPLLREPLNLLVRAVCHELSNADAHTEVELLKQKSAACIKMQGELDKISDHLCKLTQKAALVSDKELKKLSSSVYNATYRILEDSPAMGRFGEYLIKDIDNISAMLLNNRQTILSKLQSLESSLNQVVRVADELQAILNAKLANNNVKDIFRDRYRADFNLDVDCVATDTMRQLHSKAFKSYLYNESWIEFDPPHPLCERIEALRIKIDGAVTSDWNKKSREILKLAEDICDSREQQLSVSRNIAAAFSAMSEQTPFPPNIPVSVGKNTNLWRILPELRNRWTDATLRELVATRKQSEVWARFSRDLADARNHTDFKKCVEAIARESTVTLDLINSPAVNGLVNELCKLCSELNTDKHWIDLFKKEVQQRCQDKQEISRSVERLAPLISRVATIRCPQLKGGLQSLIRRSLEVINRGTNPLETLTISINYQKLCDRLSEIETKYKAWLLEGAIQGICETDSDWREAGRAFLSSLRPWSVTPDKPLDEWVEALRTLADRHEMLTILESSLKALKEAHPSSKIVCLHWLQQRDENGSSSAKTFKAIVDNLNDVVKEQTHWDQVERNIPSPRELDVQFLDKAMGVNTWSSLNEKQNIWRTDALELWSNAQASPFEELLTKMRLLNERRQQFVVDFEALKKVALRWNDRRLSDLESLAEVTNKLSIPINNVVKPIFSFDGINDWVDLVRGQRTFIEECRQQQEELQSALSDKLNNESMTLLKRIQEEENPGAAITLSDIPPLMDLRDKGLIDLNISLSK